ncbi:MAG: GntR family transcriptional regulator [Lachnospiraceae bacterium]|nr:GntR family transcriptional regulator [Lachnospiraceae bacterium]
MFQIDYNSNLPIYEQLVRKMKENILKGYLKAGDSLPSVRNMARQLGVTPNTIQKAYRMLEQENVIVTIRGKGAFVAEMKPVINMKEKLMDYKAQLKPLIGDMLYHGMKKEEIWNMIEEIIDGIKEESHD